MSREKTTGVKDSGSASCWWTIAVVRFGIAQLINRRVIWSCAEEESCARAGH
jgi:hypothetical protein